MGMVNAHCSESPHAVMVSFFSIYFSQQAIVQWVLIINAYGINERRMWDEITMRYYLYAKKNSPPWRTTNFQNFSN